MRPRPNFGLVLRVFSSVGSSTVLRAFLIAASLSSLALGLLAAGAGVDRIAFPVGQGPAPPFPDPVRREHGAGYDPSLRGGTGPGQRVPEQAGAGASRSALHPLPEELPGAP